MLEITELSDGAMVAVVHELGGNEYGESKADALRAKHFLEVPPGDSFAAMCMAELSVTILEGWDKNPKQMPSFQISQKLHPDSLKMLDDALAGKFPVEKRRPLKTIGRFLKTVGFVVA